MKERIWLSNYSLDDIQGGTEIVGEQYCRSLKLKYISSGKAGVSLNLLDEWINRRPLELIVYNSTNGWSRKFDADKSICVCCENFKTEADSVDDSEFKRMKMAQWELQKKSLENADKIIVLSRGEQKAFEKEGFKTTVIEPYIDLESFCPIDTEKRKTTGLFVGRKHMRKGYDIVLGLERSFPGVRFVKVTDGNLGIKELNRLYNEADFMIMPSRYESFGFIYAEAMATNLPIISSRVGIFKDWQPKEYGIFPEELTLKSFEDALFYEFPKLILSYEKSRPVAETRFSFDRFRREINDFVNNW